MKPVLLTFLIFLLVIPVIISFRASFNNLRTITTKKLVSQSSSNIVTINDSVNQEDIVSIVKYSEIPRMFVSSFLTVLLDMIHIINKIIYEPIRSALTLFGIKKQVDMNSFYSGKTVWITGASSGIGESIANQLSLYKSNLILSARNINKLEEVAKSCRKNYKDIKIIILPIDLEKSNNYNNICNDVENQLRTLGLNDTIDILINNAGISSRGTAIETDLSVLQKIMVYI
jgi:hypothetical protein